VGGVAESVRPRNVVIVDADNPLVEVQGEFFWREDHERIVARERDRAFQLGYLRGLDAAKHAAAKRVVVRYRPGLLRRLVSWLFVLFVAVAFLVTLISSIVSDIHNR